MSDAEWAWLRERAEADGISTAEFVRRRALRGMIAERKRGKIATLNRET
jgi:hypothetical protein